jgi:predicted Rossmann-fold nucleotide-binding protein
VAFLDQMTAKGFLENRHREALIVSSDIEEMLEIFRAYQAPRADIRLENLQT